jgi:hypothetical protein
MLNSDDQSPANNFIIMFCCEGLESIVHVTELEHQRILNILAGKPASQTVPRIVHFLELRARYNPQRFYEIWAINAVEGITTEDISEMFENCPQTAADTIRGIGTLIFGEKRSKKNAIV